jgi:hypothetical protein
VAHLVTETDAFRLQLVLVTATEAERSAVTDLAAVPGHAGIAAAYDPSGRLTSTYLPTGARSPTAVLVHADGVVEAIVDGVTGTTPLPGLPTLAHAGASTSG